MFQIKKKNYECIRACVYEYVKLEFNDLIRQYDAKEKKKTLFIMIN